MLPSPFRRVNSRRLVHVATADHRYTLGDIPALLAAQGVTCESWSWDQVFRARRLPRATWILTDFDRLAPGPLEIGGRVHARLTAEGMRVLNDPRRFRNRAQLLRALQAEGINGFGCAWPAAGEWPARWPAFLRTIAAHRGIIGGLLQDRDQAEAAIAAALAKGFALSDLVLVEYAAEPVAETGHFQKHAAFRVGAAYVRANTVNDKRWKAKTGVAGMATDAIYAAERAEYDDWPHAAFVARVFAVAGMDFGRVDFGLSRGRAQAWEVNTNPTMLIKMAHANADRRAALELFRGRLVAALAAETTPATGRSVAVSDLFAPARSLLRRPYLF
jgi:hypothetical protein